MIKYAIHPQIICTVDNKTTYVGYIELIRLYNLDHEECTMWSNTRPETLVGKNFNDYIHLYPQADGNYKL